MENSQKNPPVSEPLFKQICRLSNWKPSDDCFCDCFFRMFLWNKTIKCQKCQNRILQATINLKLNNNWQIYHTHNSYPFIWIFWYRNKLRRPQAYNVIKKRLWHRRFPMKFAKIFLNNFFIEHLRWLFLE